MIVLSYRRACSFVISRFENAFKRFTEGKPIDGKAVADFFVEQQPSPGSIHDLVYLHRLAQSYIRNPPAEIKKLLDERTVDVMADCETLSSGQLSVLISCLTDWRASPDLNLTRAVQTILDREHLTLQPRIFARICKGIACLAKTKEENMQLFAQKAQELLHRVPVAEVLVSDMIEIANLAASKSVNFTITHDFLEHAKLLVPFMSDTQARRSLDIFSKIEGSSEIVDELKRNLVRHRPKRSKAFTVDGAGLPETPKAPHYEYVRKLDLR
jgi:hypothetical protein